MDGSIATRRSGIERRGEAPGSVTGAASERASEASSGRRGSGGELARRAAAIAP